MRKDFDWKRSRISVGSGRNKLGDLSHIRSAVMNLMSGGFHNMAHIVLNDEDFTSSLEFLFVGY
jgi:hypothetical protein